MSTPRAARTMSQPLPAAADVHIETVGTTATEVDLFAELLGGGSAPTERLPAKFRVTFEGDGSFYILALSATGGAAVAAGTGKRIPADQPRSYEVDAGRRFVSIIADAADTRVEITRG